MLTRSPLPCPLPPPPLHRADTLAGADLTIMEEGFELLERLEGLVSRRTDLPPLPMFTSCCPGWIGFVETCAPEIIPHVSTCKSPHMMVGAVLKTYFAEVGAVPTQLAVHAQRTQRPRLPSSSARHQAPAPAPPPGGLRRHALLPLQEERRRCPSESRLPALRLPSAHSPLWCWRPARPAPCPLVPGLRRRSSAAPATSAWCPSCPACANRARPTA